MITNFSIFKATKEKDNQPDYSISAKIGEEYVTIGAGWIKESQNGKFISCKLSEPYKERPGFEITMQEVTKQNDDEPLL